jgi:Flp pilus assembly secretin CpaC
MMVSVKSGGRAGIPNWARVAALAFMMIVTGVELAQAADSLTIVLDKAQILKLPERVGTIIIGNPLIADVSIQAGGVMVVTGKGYGTTNIMLLDRAGNVLMNKSVQVTGPRDDVVVVYRGIERESYSCSPGCERRITLGDTPAYFDATLGQIGTRIGQAITAK